VITVKRALVSVSDKTGLVDFARALSARGVEIVSTGGTAALLADAGVPVRSISDLTGFPEILDGRVKTLTPQVHAGILARRDEPGHMKQLADLGLGTIDLVVVNLYPFEATIRKPGVTFEEAIENIDIGGPTMLRSAAKNFEGVVVVTDPADYGTVLANIEMQGGVDASLSFRLARKVFAHTSRYDGLIASWLETHGPEGTAQPVEFPPVMTVTIHRRQPLRYGENPHQKAALYEAPGFVPEGLVQAEVLQGKELSFNNFLDLDSAWGIVNDFAAPAVTIIKHTNPCGAAIGSTPLDAYVRALESDPVSAYGGIVGCNREIDALLAAKMGELFLEAVVAPGYTPEALEILGRKKNLRVLRLPQPGTPVTAPDMRTISGGLLLQDRDGTDRFDRDSVSVVTRRRPTDSEWLALDFGWKIVRHLKSNAVAFAAPDRLLSMGSGQTSRVEAVRLARAKSRFPLQGSVLASDAFFPFRDGLDLTAEAGARAVIQPGGSVRDDEVTAAADERGMAMVFTGRRHFKH
jgi:phosphoribosylaminoimidazolecarboxamide formyltransferase/IMP cyclohydrolase